MTLAEIEEIHDQLLALAWSLHQGKTDLDKVQEAMELAPEAEILAIQKFLERLDTQDILNSLPDSVYLGDSKTW